MAVEQIHIKPFIGYRFDLSKCFCLNPSSVPLGPQTMLVNQTDGMCYFLLAFTAVNITVGYKGKIFQNIPTKMLNGVALYAYNNMGDHSAFIEFGDYDIYFTANEEYSSSVTGFSLSFSWPYSGHSFNPNCPVKENVPFDWQF